MTTTQNLDLTITIDADDTAEDFMAMQASTDDPYPFAVWYDEAKTIVKLRMNAERLAAADRTIPAFSAISFAPRA